MKKLIALSTLSHLGFIGIAFSCGLLYLSFFHLLVHALFKSLLFMAIGDIIINLFHSQDIRFLSSGYSFTKSSSYIIGVSLMNLLGLPFISGFFSKDLVLETCNFSIVSYIVLVVIFINVLFTFNYRYSLFYFIFSSLKTSSFFIYSSPILLHSVLLFSLSIVSVVFGSF